jgi:transcriptional regulator
MGRPQKPSNPSAMNTLDLLILSRLMHRPQHGFGIAEYLKEMSDEALLIEEGSLYPALHRLEAQGFITSEWGVTDKNRKARFYELTARGRRQVSVEISNWRRLVALVDRVIDPGVS